VAAYRVFDVQIETAQRTTFAFVPNENILSGRRYINRLDDQRFVDLVGMD